MVNLEHFELVDNVTEADIDIICDLTQQGWAEDGLWQGTMRNVAYQDAHKFLADIHKTRLGTPYTRYFKMQEMATGRVVAWTSLLWPQPDEPVKQGQAVMKIQIPHPPGMDERMAKIFFRGSLSSSDDHGYDRGRHFLRTGTFVHPDYQRNGLGTWLTNHCNEIADNAGGTTFVGARPTARPLFEKCGFRVVATREVDLKGDGSDIEVHWVMRRDPETK